MPLMSSHVTFNNIYERKIANRKLNVASITGNFLSVQLHHDEDNVMFLPLADLSKHRSNCHLEDPD